MLSTIYTPFGFELTWIKVTRKVTNQNPTAPADFNAPTNSIIFNNLARVVNLNNAIQVDDHDTQIMADYCIYFDRSLTNIILMGDTIELDNNQLGTNTQVNTFTYKGTIIKISYPQSQSTIGGLECYISATN